ncbi:hypothetical protein Sjap_024171 [Stephania japonica]|uniref:Uncharacterized protein n=1 Tax=Stephania japonica TaxID=461633 RepID=A0AAP0ED35_9MAGN
MKEAGATRRRDRERRRDRVARPTEKRRPPRPDGGASTERDQLARPDGESETIERDGRVGTRRSAGATRRRDRERRRDRVARPDGETETTATGRRSEHRRDQARTTGRRDETIERDGRVGTRRSAGATRRRGNLGHGGLTSSAAELCNSSETENNNVVDHDTKMEICTHVPRGGCSGAVKVTVGHR